VDDELAATDVGASALLLLDLQEGYLAALPEPDELLRQVRRALDAARAARMTVIHVRLSFRPGQPEVSARNRMFGRAEARGHMIEGSVEVRAPSLLDPEPGEPVLRRPRSSAFAGSDLAEILRAGQVTTLVLTGTATSGVVLATACAADDLDFAVFVLVDGVADPTPGVDDVLLGAVLPQYAAVVSTTEFCAALDGSAG
jgi:nicotinamidase-related amidase